MSRLWEEQKGLDGGSEVLGLFNDRTKVKCKSVQNFQSEYLTSVQLLFINLKLNLHFSHSMSAHL